MPPKLSLTDTPIGKTTSETGLTEPETGKTMSEISLTETSAGKTANESTIADHLMVGKTGNKGGRPPKPVSTTAVTWSVRGVGFSLQRGEKLRLGSHYLTRQPQSDTLIRETVIKGT
ncbi:hypothetical protein [Hymenobacter antarcticus]|uniref:Uncharacterized protein n=1 Tax=Hymenobacter antarcticus TaxID=486270 RepID=A0ABP7Q632_9BACT